ncbi:MAG: hypothetical protein WBL23_03750 [Salinisphaera sp.]|uniref:hypothetical protein n=1 Tax=Salinisphaera sp. TaxID=1914330 RepID=UPI003C79D025
MAGRRVRRAEQCRRLGTLVIRVGRRTRRPPAARLRVRATDEHGQRQPDAVPRNDHGMLFNGVAEHPVCVDDD